MFDSKLLTDTESLDGSSVSLDVVVLEILEKVSSLTDHLEQTASGVVVLLVCLEVFCEVTDPSCKDSDLYLGRACVGLVSSVGFDHSRLFVFSEHFHYLFLKYFPLKKNMAGNILN